VKRVPSSGATNSHQTVDDGSPVPETDSTSLSKENLMSRVYTLMRDVAGFDPNKLDMALSQVGTNLPRVELKIW
jgi:hypothetical protein